MKKRQLPLLLSIKQFCQLMNISRTTYFALQGLELGPDTIKIGRAVRIKRSAAMRWLERISADNEAEGFNSKKPPARFRDW